MIKQEMYKIECSQCGQIAYFNRIEKAKELRDYYNNYRWCLLNDDNNNLQKHNFVLQTDRVEVEIKPKRIRINEKLEEYKK